MLPNVRKFELNVANSFFAVGLSEKLSPIALTLQLSIEIVSEE